MEFNDSDNYTPKDEQLLFSRWRFALARLEALTPHFRDFRSRGQHERRPYHRISLTVTAEWLCLHHGHTQRSSGRVEDEVWLDLSTAASHWRTAYIADLGKAGATVYASQRPFAARGPRDENTITSPPSQTYRRGPSTRPARTSTTRVLPPTAAGLLRAAAASSKQQQPQSCPERDRRRHGACARRLCDPTDRLTPLATTCTTPTHPAAKAPWPPVPKACWILPWAEARRPHNHRRPWAVACPTTSMHTLPSRRRPVASTSTSRRRRCPPPPRIMHPKWQTAVQAQQRTQSAPGPATPAAT